MFMTVFFNFSGQNLKKTIITLQALRFKLTYLNQTCLSSKSIMQLTKTFLPDSASFIEKRNLKEGRKLTGEKVHGCGEKEIKYFICQHEGMGVRTVTTQYRPSCRAEDQEAGAVTVGPGAAAAGTSKSPPPCPSGPLSSGLRASRGCPHLCPIIPRWFWPECDAHAQI